MAVAVGLVAGVFGTRFELGADSGDVVGNWGGGMKPLAHLPATAIRLRNVTLGYDKHPAVHHLSLGIAHGSLVAIVGPNGAGKSTLLKALAGQLRPLQGELEGVQGQRMAYLPQQASMDRSFPITVQDMVAMGLWHEVGVLRGFKPEHIQRCRWALTQVGLSGFEKRALDTLSGGQFQRALFARLMLQDAPIVLLDEPFAAVDARTTRDLLAILHTWHQAGKTVIAVLHDLGQVRDHFPLTMMIARELIAWGPTASVLTEPHWARAQALHEAFDEQAPVCQVDANPETEFAKP
jgi:zinc/manganese transport system ATP-binding protein